ncbi:MAG TPA: SDR family NAD(P)-dependent oxidoreductase [Hyphomicrobium sp.]|nr:SDR family NAD(P)-dependent oxidoreductase [Hyphomicrobium sp.]
MTEGVSGSKVCVVAGVGPGNGAALVRRFASEGYAVAMFARSPATMGMLAEESPQARAYVVDLMQPDDIKAALEKVQSDLGPVDVLVYNAGNAVWGSVLEVSDQDFEALWRVNALGAIAASRFVLNSMISRGAGQIVFVGATASRRGGPKSAAFAPAKAAQRSLAESLARSYGPLGVHVSLVIVDGAIDEPRSRSALSDKAESFFIQPDHVAATVFYLTQQSRSAWTFELDIRPFGEKW